MSFRGILTAISKVFGGVATASNLAVTVLAPQLSPQAAAVLNRANGAIQGAEYFIRQAQAGPIKKANVVEVLKAEIPAIDELVQHLGPGATFDEGKLAELVDAAALTHNKLQEFMATVKKVNLGR